ncbi:hypothetical protein HK096_002936, partial [Nowakowskiella sp. JEL0078]
MNASIKNQTEPKTKMKVTMNRLAELVLNDQQFMAKHWNLMKNPQANKLAIQKAIFEFAAKKNIIEVPTSNPATSFPHIAPRPENISSTNLAIPNNTATPLIKKYQSSEMISQASIQNIQNAAESGNDYTSISSSLEITPKLILSTPLPIVSKIPLESQMLAQKKDPLSTHKIETTNQEQKARNGEKRKYDSDSNISGIVDPPSPQKRHMLHSDNSIKTADDFSGALDKELNPALGELDDFNSLNTSSKTQPNKSQNISSISAESISPKVDVDFNLKRTETEKVQSSLITLDDECVEMQKISGVQCKIFKHDNGL